MRDALRIGIITDGTPRIIAPRHERVVVRTGIVRWIPKSPDARVKVLNMKIGDGFHWQSTIAASLPGIIELHQDSKHELVNIVNIEDYLERVVGSEMNIEAPIEFLKAHAIISRSWAYGKIQRSHNAGNTGKVIANDKIITWEDTADHVGFDVCSDDHCQRYQGDTDINEIARRAIGETSGMVLCDAAGEIADCRFSKCCGGVTEIFSTCWQDIDFPYLVSQPCPHCNPSTLDTALKSRLFKSCLKNYDSRSKDFYHWNKKIPHSLIIDNLKKYHNINADYVVSLSPLHRGPSQRIDLIEVGYISNGNLRYLELGKELSIRRMLSPTALYSSRFEITDEDADYFHISGYGWGHGVGLCQIGAAVMALKGASHQEILSFYYPNTVIQNITKLK